MIEPPDNHQDDPHSADANPAEEKHPPEIQLEAETVSVEPVPRWIQGGPDADPPALEVPPAGPPPHRDAYIPPASAEPPKPRNLTPWLGLVLAVVLILVGTSPFWAPPLASVLPWGAQPEALPAPIVQAPTTSDTDALTQRLQQDEAALKDVTARVGQLEARPATPPAASNPADANANTESAEQRAALQDQIAKLNAALATLGDRQAKLEAGAHAARDESHSRENLLMALANLRSALAGSGPFAPELDAVTALAPQNEAVTALSGALAPSAHSGIPGIAVLAERFSHDTAPAILRAVPVTDGTSWSDWFTGHVKRLIVIRRINPTATTPNDPTEDAVARAEAALKTSDLAGAVDAVGHLSGLQAEAAASWLADAQKRLTAEAAIAKTWQALANAPVAGGAKP